MKAVLLRETGGPERLEYADVPDPEPEPGQKLVRVRAAGVNFLDLLVREGRYVEQPQLPFVPGIEVAGEVDGRRVMGLPRGIGGGYAERTPVDDEWLFPLPDSASFADGAAFLITFLTVYPPLVRRVRPGTTVLVHAAAGGIGTAAVQVARHLGARVIGVASTDEKRALAAELGAGETFAYDEFAERARADVVVDPVGGDVFTASLKVLKPFGTLLAVGFAGGPLPPLEPPILLGRNVGVHGVSLGRLMRVDPAVVHDAADELLALWERGAIRPVVGAQYPLAEAAAAHRLIGERRHLGKVVLVP